MRSNSETGPETASDTRRGAAPADEAYLRRVGERVRLGRARRGMSRKVLSRASGVSERYLAELERGAGNASLLVLRQIAQALSIEASALVSDEPERPIDLTLAIHQLERLSPAELAEARQLIAQRFGMAGSSAHGRIALVGLRGAGKTTLGQLAAEALAVPFIELDREVEREAGARLDEVFALYGQDAFRRFERRALERVLNQNERAVIATGGGAVLAEANRRRIAERAIVVYLHARPGHLWHRVKHDRNRPLLATPDPQKRLEELYAQRDPLYREVADLVLDTGKQSVQTLAKDLLARLDAECRLSA